MEQSDISRLLGERFVTISGNSVKIIHDNKGEVQPKWVFTPSEEDVKEFEEWIVRILKLRDTKY